jgi:sulfotransferase family protein
MSLRKKLTLVGLYATSLLQNRRNAEFFRAIQTYCMFVGYPRTGHSLIGSLLDAHPRIVIAHELDALKLFQRGFSRRQVFHLLLENSRKTAAAGRSHSGYSYEVPNQWQGRFEQLQVLGDKKGATSAMRFYLDPGLLEFVRRKIANELKFVHVMRNPYDVLATMTRRSPRKTLDTHIDVFFQLCSSIERLKKQFQPTQIYDVRLESFIEDPKPHLASLCSFIGVKAEPRYLEDCASIVFKSPKKSRFDIAWDQESIAKVCERMEPFSFLAGYAYDEENAASTSAPPSPAAHEERPRPRSYLGLLTTGKLLLAAAYSMTDGILTSLPI